MAEYASKGVAGTALGLGIAGTVGLVNQLSGCLEVLPLLSCVEWMILSLSISLC